MRIVAAAGEPPVVIPPIVVAVDVHIALVIPTVERGRIRAKCHPYHHPLNILRAVSYSASVMPEHVAPSIFIF